VILRIHRSGVKLNIRHWTIHHQPPPPCRQLNLLSTHRGATLKYATRNTACTKIWKAIHRSLTGTAPAYLSMDCRLTSDTMPRSLRSSDCRACEVRRTKNTFGDRCFAVAGPAVWNGLPLQLRQPDISSERFRRLLKTFLFG